MYSILSDNLNCEIGHEKFFVPNEVFRLYKDPIAIKEKALQLYNNPSLKRKMG